jgi:hypothetical protein
MAIGRDNLLLQGRMYGMRGAELDRLKALMRQPGVLVMTLVHPVIWLFSSAACSGRSPTRPDSTRRPIWTTWSYTVRWVVASRPRSRTFTTRALADHFRSDRMQAINRGEAFDVDAGLPDSLYVFSLSR